MTQLYALGLSKDQVSDRAAAGWLHRLHRGIHAVGHLQIGPAGRWMAAVLAVGNGAVLSHESAAVVDFLWRDARLVVEVDGHATHGTRPAFQADRDRDGRPAVAGYRVRRFTWWDVTRRSVVVADRVRRLLD